MAKAIRQRIALDLQVQKWLEAKGIDLNMVREDYTIARDFGMTTLTITLFAGDFPLDEIKPTAEHSQCGPNCTFKNETPSE